MTSTRFSKVSAVEARGVGTWAANLHPGWTIVGKPNGGYLLATLGRAALGESEFDDLIVASAQFIRPPQPGPVSITVETLRAGRSTSQHRARMSQGEHACVEALINLGHLKQGAQPYWSRDLSEPDATPFEECQRLQPTGQGFDVAIMDEVEVRLEPASAGFATAEPSGRGELRGWLALPEDEAFDSLSLVYALDAFPPVTLELGIPGWVPTLQLSTSVRAVPEPGPVRVLQRSQLIRGDLLDETCLVWDSAGALVAHGSQLAAVRT